MPLDLAVQRIADDTAVLSLTGALTLGTGLKTVDTQILSLVENGVSNLVLDLSGVPYIDSAGLGTIIHTLGLVGHRGGRLRICGISERVGAMLKMTRTDAFLPVDANLAASLAGLR